MPTATSLNSKAVDKALKKSIKKVLHQRGLSKTTRKGSKELNNLTRRISQEPFDSFDAVNQLGEQIGAQIAEATQQGGGDRLHQGPVRKLVMQGEVQALVATSTATLPPQEEAAINTAALPTEAEASGAEPATPAEPVAPAEQIVAEAEPTPTSVSEPAQTSEDAEPSPVSASVEDSPEELPEEEVSEAVVSEGEDETS